MHRDCVDGRSEARKRGPANPGIALQRLNALSQDGKLSYDDLGIAQEWVAAYEAKGELVDVEALIGEIVPILKQRMKHLAAREMIQRVGSGGDTSKAAKMLEKADNLGNAGAERLVMRTYSPDMAAADPIKWLWKGYLARGALHLLVSDEGMGKSSMMRDLATRLAMGRELPGEDAESRDPESTLIVCPEDGPDQIAARLKDAGLDGDGWSRVHVAEGSGLCLPKDIADLEGKIRDTGASLVVIELHSLDKGSADKTDDVHRALDPLAFLAKSTGAAIVVVRHTNKLQTGNARQTANGSHAWQAVARVVLRLAPAPDDQGARVLVVAKKNTGYAGPAIGIREVPDLTGPRMALRLKWDTSIDDISANCGFRSS